MKLKERIVPLLVVCMTIICTCTIGVSASTGSGYFTYPLSGVTKDNMSAGYGMYDPWGTGKQTMHYGADFPAAEGTPIYASAPGKVIAANYGDQGYGNHVIIQHEGNYTTLYGHCRNLAVSYGTQVNRGDIIGYVGMTGNATGNHVHFEIRIDGKAVDPIPFLENTNDATAEIIDQQMSEFTGQASLGFQMIKSVLLGTDEDFLYLNPIIIVQSVSKFLLPISYMIFFICWMVGIAKKSIDLSIYSGKEFSKIGASLIAGLILMGLATPITSLIAEISQSLTKDLINSTTVDALNELAKNIKPFNDFSSSIPIIGPILQFLTYFTAQFPLLIFNFGLIIVSLIIMVIAGIRIVKMAIMQACAPVFFAMSASESTMRYFRNFMIQYCLIAFQLFIMAIVYSAMQISFAGYISAGYGGEITQWGTAFIGMIIMITYCVLMIKSDKIFSKILQ